MKRISHPKPAAREQGDTEVPVRLVFAGQTEATDVEVLWCQKLDTSRYALCCIPFVLGGLALGDEMLVAPDAEGSFRLSKVVQTANNMSFRAWFGNSSNPDAYQEVLEELGERGYLTEEFSEAQVIAINAQAGEQAQVVERLLEKRKAEGALSYDKTYSSPLIDYKIHLHPVRGEAADSIVHAVVEHEGSRDIRESLWAKHLGGNRYESCCIPFFVYGLALGDEVEARLDDAGTLLFDRVVEPSGNETFWILFNEPYAQEVRTRVYEKITGLGCIVEGYNKALLAFNAGSESQANLAVALLRDECEKELLDCVSGKTA